MAKEKQIYQTPKAEALYPYIQTPFTKFDPEGKYKTALKFNPNQPDHLEFLKTLRRLDEEYATQQKAPTKNKPWAQEIVDDKKTGLFLVNFKTSFPPAVFDSHGKRITENISIGTGSVLKVAFVTEGYKGFGGGITLYLQGVQVFDLIKFEGYNADTYGFEEEEGFSIEDVSPESPNDFMPDPSIVDQWSPAGNDEQVPSMQDQRDMGCSDEEIPF